MSRLKPEQTQRALDMHRECMEDPEYAAKWNALMDQMGRFVPGIPEEAKQPAKTTRELYPNAICNTCEWAGPRSDLLPDAAAPLDELCPECGSADTEWAPALSGDKT